MQKTAPDGRMIYSRVLGGASEDLPRQFFFDAQDNVVLLGITWSSNFPATADAVQRAYAGPSPSIPTFSRLLSGGDLFLSVLTTAGDLLYSTFLGSSGSDSILGIRAASDEHVDVLINAAGANFPVVPAGAATPSSGPVLLSIDLNRRAIARVPAHRHGGRRVRRKLSGGWRRRRCCRHYRSILYVQPRGRAAHVRVLGVVRVCRRARSIDGPGR